MEVLGNALKGKIVILFPAPSRIILIFKAYSMIKNKLTHLEDLDKRHCKNNNSMASKCLGSCRDKGKCREAQKGLKRGLC